MSALRQLADACGVHTQAPSADGTPRPVSDETLRRVLAALGVGAADDAAVAASLRSIEQAAWTHSLPPVVVVRADAAAVPITLPQGTKEVAVTLALETGTENRWTREFGELQLLDAHTVDGTVLERRLLRLGAVPWGYHRFTLASSGASTDLVASPAQCFLPDGAANARLWGISAQLYLLRSEHNWGIGDLTDLRMLVEQAAKHGADVVGINPLHMPFPDNPEHASPYSPASRLLLNELNIDVAALAEAASSEAFAALIADEQFSNEIAASRQSRHVDYRRVAALKTRSLQAVLEDLGAEPTSAPEALAEFRRERGASFERHCVYFALRHALIAQGHSGDWRQWPDGLHDCGSPAVARFVAEHPQELLGVAWRQWLADRQLAAAADAAADMALGIYRDLAVGADASGAETWSEPDLVVPGMSVGSPPDAMSAQGQDWGLPPFNPLALRAQRYRNFIELLRANMRHAGALRIDHAMGLQRLYFVPHGASATEGTYVDYPREDLLGILALESHRQRCVVIGEDLGTVPAGFRVRMSEANVLSYRVLVFEREAATQKVVSPTRYPELAIAVSGNHDLPTFAGWWNCTDIALQDQLGVLSTEERDAALRARSEDKKALCAALREESLIGPSEEPSLERLLTAVHRLLGRTRALLATAQLDDLCLEQEPVNMPSTQRYPNWRRKLGKTLEELAASAQVAAELAALAAEREAAAPKNPSS